MKKSKKSFYLIAAVVAAVLLMIVFRLALPGSGDSSDIGDPPVGEDTADSKDTFPYELEEGKLEITSLFQSDIPNPDKGFEESVNLASIELVNKSGEYLKSADITITLEDETKLTFQVSDIPAGKTVWVFDKAGTEIGAESKCLEIQCEAEFDPEYAGWEGQFLTEADAAMTTITNLTEQEQTDIKVIFHCVVDGIYFGGTSYEYHIEKLSPQESTVLEVFECYFGDSEAVQIVY